MKVGPFGAYVQLGETSKKQKPRRTTLPKAYLFLPRTPMIDQAFIVSICLLSAETV